MALRGAEKNKILELLKDNKVTTIVLTGDAGVGKTWIARKIADSADKKGLYYVTLWVFLSQQDDKKSLFENMSLYENIARQLSVLTTIEEWEDNATKEEDHEEEKLDSLKNKISAKLEEMRLPDPEKCLLLIVDGVPNTINEEDIVSAFEKIMHLNGQALFKVLITRRKEQVVEENETKSEIIEIEPFVEGNETKSEIIKKEGSVEGNKTKSEIIKIEPLSNEEGSSLFKERFTKNVSGIDDFAKIIAEKSKGLPAAIVVIAEALNRIVEHDCEVWTLESAMKEAATCEDAHNSANPLLRCGYEMLPKRDKALIDCCWYSLQFFLKHGGVHYNELIACWILEGYFGPVDHVEKVYEEGHRVLVELIDRHLLKIRDDNAVVVEGLALTILDSCPDRNEGKSSLGLARVFEGGHWQGFGRITHADGLIKTMCNRDKWDKVSTLLIDGSRLSREVLDTFFKPMQGLEVLALFNPTIKSLPSNLSEKTKMDKLRLLVLRGCDLLENVDDIKELKSLTVLEISGATSLKKIPDDFFHKLLQLRSLKLSAVQIKSLPSSISELSELRWLILRGCASLEELPRLQKLENLLVLDLSGAIELRKLKDKTFKAHAKLRKLDLSQTKIDRLPFLKNLGNLTQLSLRSCECLTRLPSLKSVSQLEILDLSGSSMLKENQDEIFPSMDGLKTLNLSNTKIRHLPSNNNSLPNLELMNLSDASSLDKIEDNIFEHLRYLRHLELSKTNLQKLPSLSNLFNLEILNLSGCSALKEIVDQSFRHMTCLQQLNLSETKIECLPSLSNLSNLCQLLLRNCVNLKELPPLESLSKLEELDLCGARSLRETEAKFLENMVHLRFLNLSGTELKLPPTSNLTNLTQLLLQRCRLSELCPNLEKCTQLEVLNLSETDIQSLPSLENFSNLRDLNLRDCTNLEKLPCLKSVTHLEVLDLWGTRVKEFPYEISQLTHLKRLNLPDLKDVQTLDWGKIKNLPEELNWDQCGIFKCSPNRPCMSLSGTEFFQYLKTNPGLWETCFKEFQFSVCAHEKEGTARDICWHRVDPNFREIYFQTLSLPEEHGKYLEIVGFDSFTGFEDALLRAEYISLIDNKFIKSLSDLAAGVKSMNVGNVMAMKGSWLERSTEMQTIFDEEANLETLWASNLPILKSVSNGNLKLECLKKLYLDCCPMLETVFHSSPLPENLEVLQIKFCDKLKTLWASNLHILKNVSNGNSQLGRLKKLYLDCCPMLETVFHSSQLPENLEVLQIKFCDKLKTLFMPNTSTDCKLQNLQKLHLVELPNLTSIGVLESKSVLDIFPSIELFKVRECPNLKNLDRIKDFKFAFVENSGPMKSRDH